MTDLALLLAHYSELPEAQRALAALQRNRFPRSALVYRDADGPVRISHPARRNQRFWRSIGGMVFGAAGALGPLLLPDSARPLSPPFLNLVGAAVGFWLGVLAGWFYSRQANPRIDLQLLEEHGKLLAPDESVLIVQSRLGRLERALRLLREYGQPEPAVFPLHPERDFEPLDSDQGQVALPLSQIRDHAVQLAREQRGQKARPEGTILIDRLEDLRADIGVICSDLGEAARLSQTVGPTAEWVLDNEYIVEGHVRDVQANLSTKFYRELPALSQGSDRGLPRVYTLARELINHTDYRLDRDNIRAFLEAYQTVETLKISELWALPLMIRIALVEAIHRLGIQALAELRERQAADYWANRLLAVSRRDPGSLFAVLAELSEARPDPSFYFGSQLAGHLYDEESALVPVRSWLERTRRRRLPEIQQREQQRQAGEQVSIGNAISSLRTLSLLDWREIFERHSLVERTLRRDPAGVYAQMDFDTRNSYREAVEMLAKGSELDEVTAAERAVQSARSSARKHGVGHRHAHIGTWLTAELRPDLIEAIGCRVPWRLRLRQWVYRHNTAIYLATVGFISLVVFLLAWAFALRTLPLAWQLGLGLLLMALASQIGVDFSNYLFTRLLPPRTLPKLDFESKGIPDAFRTLVTVPVLFNDEESIRQEIEDLEIRYLANPEANLAFSLFVDYPDATEPELDSDQRLLELAIAGVEDLNQRHGQGSFYLFHRQRVWTESERAYIGWERKRGKLEELNRIIAGEDPESQPNITAVGDQARLVDFRFVITLDRDTQLPRDSARRMVETLAHPLNQPRITEDGLVEEGSYTIIQPRVTTSLPSATATPFSRLFTNPVGVDPYTRAVSDVYQDLTGEGSYHGKGIYDPRAFQRVLGGRFPEQRLLSHDLIEGAYVRVGLASDIELFDDFPSDYLTYARREHRWIRGDWQIAEWILPTVPDGEGGREPNPLSWLNRWKIFDNLRRSLVVPASLALIIASWFVSTELALAAAVLTAVVLLFQPLAIPLTWATSRARFRSLSLGQIRREILRSLAKASLLHYESGLALDAIARALYRRWVSGRRLLQWTTAQVTGVRSRGRLPVLVGTLALISAAFGLIGAFAVWTSPTSELLILLWLALWLASPIVGWALNRKPEVQPARESLSTKDQRRLRQVARRTWRYFDDFVGPETAWLPPDNFQVSHQNQLAMRTSPTNIGMWLLSALAAADLGYLTPSDLIGRLAASIEALQSLQRHRGHPLNWYSLPALEPLEPRYISFVDSGNFVASLWALNSGLDELINQQPDAGAHLTGLRDTAEVLAVQIGDPENDRASAKQIHRILNLLEADAVDTHNAFEVMREVDGLTDQLVPQSAAAGDPLPESAYWMGKLKYQSSAILDWWRTYYPWLELVADRSSGDLRSFKAPLNEQLPALRKELPTLLQLATGEWPVMQAVKRALESGEIADPEQLSWLRQISEGFQAASAEAAELVERIQSLRDSLAEYGAEVDLRFLYDQDRRLFSVGYNLSENRLDRAYYDMLASEARLGSFVAIARGEVPVEHWLALTRPYGSRGRQRVLMSWTGTMFEYLMPHLLQRTYSNSLLEKAAKEAVQLHIEYGRERGVPWGISESAFGDLDFNRTYQYRAFGVPWLGLKRGLEEDLVIAPYATMLALMVRPQSGLENLEALADLGLYNAYGYYEAIDFNRRASRDDERGVTVRAYMAHHQGMSLLSIINLLLEDRMQQRFHADRRVKSAEPLLYERVPIDPVLHHLATREELPSRAETTTGEPSVSTFDTAHTVTPKVQLLSNGQLSSMVTNAGGGYLRWNDLEITRWRADTTKDGWGSFFYIRDFETDKLWSNTYQPVGHGGEGYRARFPLDRAEFSRRDHGIETESEVIVSPEDDVEIRRITLTNRTLRMRYVELTSYLELAMAAHKADRQHPAFNKLFIETESHQGGEVLLARRRLRENDEQPVFVGHRLTFHEEGGSVSSYETDRRVFIGRGGDLRSPAGLKKELNNTHGYVLDPIFSLRGSLRLAPGQSKTISMVQAVADSRGKTLHLIEKYADPSTIDRAFELSWASTQLELRMLRIHPDEARRFQKLASFMLYPSAMLRPPEERLRENTKSQSGLWPYGISGDLPIALVTIDDTQDISLVRQMLQAHSYWRQHGLAADLVILNEESSSYERPLNERLERVIKAFSVGGADQAGQGGVYLLSADQLPAEDINLLLAVARVSLVAARGPLAQQLGAPAETPEWPEQAEFKESEPEPSAPLPYLELPYFNSLGGFTEDGREYVIYLGPNSKTPAPWINVMANPNFGTIVSESGAGFTWYGNSQRNRLTEWSNDPVQDPSSEAIYLRDEVSGQMWSPTPQPARAEQAYRVRHGAGYSIFEHNSHGLEMELTTFVPVDDQDGEPIKVSRLRIHNDSNSDRALSATYFVEWTLGETREDSGQFIVTEWDEDSEVLLARNPYHDEYGSRVAFMSIAPGADSYSGDRTAFLGRNGRCQDPAALERVELSNRIGAGFDPCGALQSRFEIGPGETREILFVLGQEDTEAAAIDLARKYLERLSVDQALEGTRGWWDDMLGTIQVQTPELSVDFMLNRWLLYQNLSCRLWARSAFYQSGGAYGFRDQLQDSLALLFARPEWTRQQLLRAAAHQFKEGDVLHWWHPPSGAGIRSRISDDLLWLPFATARYVEATGDLEVLEEEVPFLQARLLEPDEHEIFLEPQPAPEPGSLWEHCQRAVEKGLTEGPHGLPLIGAGDWNDGMNRVGIEGRGESIWLAWFLIEVLNRMARLAEARDELELAGDYRRQAQQLAERVEQSAWDGAWYLRAFFDNGQPLGSSRVSEGWIDSLPQSWSVISQGARPERAEQALQSAYRHLVRRQEDLVLLFTPPFDDIEPSPGYIRAYPPGVRENGGQYTHAALWLAIAAARSGDGDQAAEILRMLNPIEHAKDVYSVWRYVVEPYVVAADVYRLTGKVGHGGWTWYTGSGGWTYRAWLEEVLGLKLRGDHLVIDPVIPKWWDGFKVRYRHGQTVYWIEVVNPEGVNQGVVSVQMDGRTLPEGKIPLERGPIKHRVQVRMGEG